jgi:hypothetical protein
VPAGPRPPLALDLLGDIPAQPELGTRGGREQVQVLAVVDRHAQLRTEEQYRAVVLAVAHAAAHALLDPLDLAGQADGAVGQRHRLAPLDAVHRLGYPVEDQQPAGTMWEVHPVVLVDEHH